MALYRQRLRRFLLAAPVGLLLSGCGFQLRGYGFEALALPIQVVGTPMPGQAGRGAPITEVLRAALRSAGASVLAEHSGPSGRVAQGTADDGVASLVLEVLNESVRRRSVSVTDQARSAEYEVSRAVQFQLRRGDEALIAPTWLSVQRVLRLDRNNIVGTNAEQVLVEQELQADLVQQVLRSVNQTLKAAG